MMILRHPETTRVLGKSQGYLGLPIVDVAVPDGEGGNYHAMISVWEPDPKELERLNNGAKVHLRMVGKDLVEGHPPVMIEVGEVPA